MIVRQFEEQVEKFPGKLAVKNTNRSLTYKELNTFTHLIADAIAGLKVANHSNTPGHIGVLLDESTEMIAGILGILRSGNVYVPMVNDFPVKRMNYIIDHADIYAIITDLKNKELVISALPENREVQIIYIENLGADRGYLQQEAILPDFKREVYTDSGASMLYTSGSTGFPKGVLQTHRNICYFIDRYTENLGINDSDHLTLLASFSHDVTLLDMYASLLSGATSFPLDLKEDGIFEALPQWLKQEEITVWHSVPTVFRYFSATLNQPLPLPKMRRIILGGEASTTADIEKFNILFRHSLRCQLYLLYGQTESSYNAGKFYKLGESVGTITLGEVNKGTELYVVDANGDEVDDLEAGEILVVNPHLSPGYWKDPVRTNERFKEDPEVGRFYFTGDYARKLPDGDIQFMGRRDNQVKIRGFRIELEEIEKLAMQYPLVVEAAVIPIDPAGQEKFLACYFVAVRDFEIKRLRAFLEERLPDYMIPTYFKQLRQLPVTVSGKIDRHALPAPEITTDTPYVAPGTSMERQLVEIWAEILQLGKEVIGIDSNFFQMGGHSLRATALTAKIHRDLEVKVPLAEVFERQTIRELAEFIQAQGKSQFTDIPENASLISHGIEPAEKKEYYPVSAGQEYIYNYQQANKENTFHNMPLVFSMDVVDVEAFNEVFRQVIRRQEVLRTGFQMVNGQLVQRVFEPEDVTFHAQLLDANPENILERFHDFIQPFDLACPPLLRIGITQVGKPQMVIFDFHHIISDNISLNLLEKDCMAFSSGEIEELPLYNVQYKDYAVWENSREHQEDLKKQEAYWLRTLSGELPILNFPYDYPRPITRTYEGSVYTFLLGKELTCKVKSYASETDTTFFNVAFSAFNILLAKICNQDEIILGTPIALRHLSELQFMIGMLTNTLPQRNFPHPDKVIAQFLGEVQLHTLEAFENREYPYEYLCNKIPAPQHPARNPIYDMMFNVVDERLYQSDTDQLGVIDRLLEMRTYAWIDLALVAVDRGDNVLMKYRYSTKLLDKETIVKLADAFIQVLSFIPDHPHSRINEIEMDFISAKGE